jgi:predicted enzyme related to lactoylglutathione lyase
MSSTVLAPGTPIWIDLGSKDVEGSKAFYGTLFGWEAQTAPEPEAGGYVMFTLNGKLVAGAAPLQDPGQPPAWTTYVHTKDAAATAQKAREAGGTVLVEPMQVMDSGTMAIFADPTGAVVGVWQPDKHTGAEVFNEPGSLTWNELATRDVEAAKAFYTRVFDWGVHAHEGYTEWQVDGRSVGGMMPMADSYPPQVPAHWLVYFDVADCAATEEKARAAGAGVMVPATEIPQGTIAVVADPQGATFAFIQAKR